MRRAKPLLLVALAALVLGAACSRGSSDEAIANSVKARMFSEAQLKSANLDVTSKNGEVTLAGEVPSDAARYLAFKLAADTPGVRKVNDQMVVKVAEVAPPEPEPAPAPSPAPAPVRKPVKQRAAAQKVELESPPPHPAPAPAPEAPPKPVEPQPVTAEIPAGTTVAIRMIDGIDSEVNHSGEVFRASLDAPLMADGEIAVPAGVDVFVKLAHASSAGRMAGRSELRLELVRMMYQGKSYLLESSTYEQLGTSRGKRTAATVGGGAAIGAAIGAIAGGGKGAAIGAAIGAGSGAGVQAATKGKQIQIPSETRLDFRLEQAVTVTYFPEKNKRQR